jgi:hypothetical protein
LSRVGGGNSVVEGLETVRPRVNGVFELINSVMEIALGGMCEWPREREVAAKRRRASSAPNYPRAGNWSGA